MSAVPGEATALSAAQFRQRLEAVPDSAVGPTRCAKLYVDVLARVSGEPVPRITVDRVGFVDVDFSGNHSVDTDGAGRSCEAVARSAEPWTTPRGPPS